MKVAFRVDSSASIGTGHHVRCMTLAESLRRRGAQLRFVCRDHEGSLIGALRERAIPVTVLPVSATSRAPGDGSYAAWLGSTQAEDASLMIEALAGEEPDWLVVDHYALDSEWEQQVRPHVGQLMVIDDLANRPHQCELLLDQNYSLQGEERYAGLVPGSCKLLTGPRYALLRPDYSEHRRKIRPRDGRVSKILVFFGGSDPANMTGKAIASLCAPQLKHLEVDVVIGANHRDRHLLEKQAEERPHTRIHGPRPHLADLMASADLAIGAGGATIWERMCLGLPSIVVSIAENQRASCEALADAKLIYYAGNSADIETDHLTRMIEASIQRPNALAGLSIRNQLQVDGLGTCRLTEAMCPSGLEELKLRPAREDDVHLYFGWANDVQVRKSAIDPSPITWETHQDWFARKLGDPDSHLLVLEAGGLPVGQIRFDRVAAQARIGYSLDPVVRGRGWGLRLMALGMKWMQQRAPVPFCADVKRDNAASCAIFLRMGFQEVQGQSGAGLRSFHLDCAESAGKEKS